MPYSTPYHPEWRMSMTRHAWGSPYQHKYNHMRWCCPFFGSLQAERPPTDWCGDLPPCSVRGVVPWCASAAQLYYPLTLVSLLVPWCASKSWACRETMLATLRQAPTETVNGHTYEYGRFSLRGWTAMHFLAYGTQRAAYLSSGEWSVACWV